MFKYRRYLCNLSRDLFRGLTGSESTEKSDKKDKKDKKLKEEDKKAAAGAEKLKNQPAAETEKLEKEVTRLPPKTPPAVPFPYTKVDKDTKVVTKDRFQESLAGLSKEFKELYDLATPAELADKEKPTEEDLKQQQTFEDLLIKNPKLLPRFKAYKMAYVALESQLQCCRQ